MDDPGAGYVPEGEEMGEVYVGAVGKMRFCVRRSARRVGVVVLAASAL